MVFLQRQGEGQQGQQGVRARGGRRCACEVPLVAAAAAAAAPPPLLPAHPVVWQLERLVAACHLAALRLQHTARAPAGSSRCWAGLPNARLLLHGARRAWGVKIVPKGGGRECPGGGGLVIGRPCTTPAEACPPHSGPQAGRGHAIRPCPRPPTEGNGRAGGPPKVAGRQRQPVGSAHPSPTPLALPAGAPLGPAPANHGMAGLQGSCSTAQSRALPAPPARGAARSWRPGYPRACLAQTQMGGTAHPGLPSMQGQAGWQCSR